MKNYEDQPVLEVKFNAEALRNKIFNGDRVESPADLALWVRAKANMLIRDIKSGEIFERYSDE